MIITIDGPVATGKSTLAKRLASAIGYIYYDTGAMYRTLTYAVLKEHVNIDIPEELEAFLIRFEFDIKVKAGDRRYFLGLEDITDKIRLSEVASQVSRVSANARVREKLVEIQRELSKGVNAVFEGRDMGSIVFPDAGLKIFLTGRPEVRAKRRYDELKEKYPEDSANLTLETVQKEIMARDEYDSTRPVSPLTKPLDAFVVDTSDLSVDELIYKILELKDLRKTKRAQS